MTARSPLFALISVLVPVAFTLLYAIVIHVSTTATIAVADNDRTEVSEQFIRVMTQLRNDDGSYYEVLTTDPKTARQLYADGEVGALLTIPAGFSAVTAGAGPQVRLELVNINADGTKNQHLRLEEVLRTFRQEITPSSSDDRLRVAESGVLPHDIPITVYLGSALMVFAALYAGIVNSAVAITREWEERTAKGLVLSPAGIRSLIAGKWLSSLVTSVATMGLAIATVGVVLGYPLDRVGGLTVTTLAVSWFYGTGLGVLLGVTLRRSLPMVPAAVIIAVVHFLAAGYESYIRGFAHGGLVEMLWQTTHWIPLARLFDAVRFEAAALPQGDGLTGALLASLLIALSLSVVAARRLSRTMTFTQGQ
ncbi:MAG: ABC transporter permease [Intrasporangium sp.]|nr:ABC transporter permease [Intrasporangium sp.]